MFKFIREYKSLTVRFIISIISLIVLSFSLLLFNFNSAQIFTVGLAFLGSCAIISSLVILDVIISSIKFTLTPTSVMNNIQENPLYSVGKLTESVFWITGLISSVFLIFYFDVFDETYISTLSSINLFLLIISLICIISTIFRFLVQFDEYKNKSNSTILQYWSRLDSTNNPIIPSLIMFMGLLLVITFILFPLIQGILFSASIYTYPEGYDTFMTAEDFENASNDDTYNNLDSVYNGNKFISYMYLTNSSNEVTKNELMGDIENPEISEKLLSGGFMAFDRSKNNNKSIGLYSRNSSGSIYSYTYQNNNTSINAYEYNKETIAGGLNYTTNIDGSELRVGYNYNPRTDIDDFINEQIFKPPLGTKVESVSTGIDEYYGQEVIVYEGIWNKLPSYYYSPDEDNYYEDKFKAYVDKNTGVLLKFEKTNIDEGKDFVYKTKPLNKSISEPKHIDDNTYEPKHAPHALYTSVDISTESVNYNLYWNDLGSRNIDIPKIDIDIYGQTLDEYDVIYKEDDGRTFRGENINNIDEGLILIENDTIINSHTLNTTYMDKLTTDLDKNGTLYLKNNGELLEKLDITYSEEYDISSDEYNFRTYYDYEESNDKIELDIYGFSNVLYGDSEYKIKYGDDIEYINNWDGNKYGIDNPYKINLNKKDNTSEIKIYYEDEFSSDKSQIIYLD